MMVDSAAKNRNRKKKLPKIRPPFIEVKMCGSVIKISFGPLSGCTLSENHAGKMMRPAVIATNVSSAAMLTASPSRDFPPFK